MLLAPNIVALEIPISRHYSGYKALIWSLVTWPYQGLLYNSLRHYEFWKRWGVAQGRLPRCRPLAFKCLAYFPLNFRLFSIQVDFLCLFKPLLVLLPDLSSLLTTHGGGLQSACLTLSYNLRLDLEGAVLKIIWRVIGDIFVLFS